MEYLYDDWGKLLSIEGELSDTLGEENPFRYRGYYFDSESGLYYLNSRYYDPETGRFISADGYISTGRGLLGYNMFTYCNNNPIMFSDPAGEFPWFIIGIIVIIVVPTVVIHIVNAVNHSNIDKEINDSYTKQTAEVEINKILSTYSEDCYISFGEDSFRINNSYNVTSRYARQKITEIISRTEETDREYDNMSAEWFGHNVCYRMKIKRSSSQHVDIEYSKDTREIINIGTKALEIFGWD